jgi:ABC-type nickel/cobalt efflux system permease component RcnA
MIEQKYHPLSFAAFVLAILILVCPTEAGIVWAALQGKGIGCALLVASVAFVIVGVPLAIAESQTRKHPEKWKPRFLSKVTGLIVILSGLLNILWFMDALKN